MSCCCTKIYALCSVNPCGDTLELPIPVILDGLHTLELDMLGKLLTTTAQQSAGAQVMLFQVSELNENFTFVGQVRDPAGAIVTFTIDQVEYNCIQFKTKRELEWNNTSSESSPS
jgi:hypothetical protein